TMQAIEAYCNAADTSGIRITHRKGKLRWLVGMVTYTCSLPVTTQVDRLKAKSYVITQNFRQAKAFNLQPSA
ncbi:MAG: hypothetical protein AABY74_04095, partial [Planctomycetota bacterium]